MTEYDIDEEYAGFWEDLLRQASVTGEPQNSAFFQLYAEMAAENGDCADLTYTPARREGRGKGAFQVDGYAIDLEKGELHLAVCDFRPERELQSLNADGLKALFSSVQRFCELAAQPEFIRSIEESSPAFEVAWQIHQHRALVRRIRCVVFSNARLGTRKKSVESAIVLGTEITLNVIDFARYCDINTSQGGMEPIELDLEELNGAPLPCLEAHLGDNGCRSYLVVMPGELLARIYGLYGARLMEQNVRTFLQAKTKVNQGILRTIQEEPSMFFAYNNGITATATEVTLKPGTGAIRAIRDLQIVNGGQTTASLLNAKDRNRADLRQVFVQMKLSLIDEEHVERVIPAISRYANTQNKVSEADFFSNHPFHIEMQKISRRLNAPAIAGALAGTKWFYERARGQYRNEQALRGTSEKRRFEAEFPKSQVIQKTELAKYRTSFMALPHVVSQGAQKCFLNFAQDVGRQWDADKARFNDDWFRNMVAEVIVFRWLDGAIGNADWYRSDRGYKANIVTYTIAVLVHHLKEKHQVQVDFGEVWRQQTPPQALQQALLQLAPQVAAKLKSPPSHIQNISEYAKLQACWAALQGQMFEIGEEVLSCTISVDEARQARKDAVGVKRIDQDIDFEVRLLRLAPKAAEIEKLAAQRKLLSPTSLKALGRLRTGATSLTRPERSALQNLFARLEETGEAARALLEA